MYKFYRLRGSVDHNTNLLISAASEILRALEIISSQLDELTKKFSNPSESVDIKKQKGQR